MTSPNQLGRAPAPPRPSIRQGVMEGGVDGWTFRSRQLPGHMVTLVNQRFGVRGSELG